MSITLILVVTTVVISIMAFNSRELLGKLLLSPYAIKHANEYHRFVSSGFIHANWVHLLINVIVLWSFGEAVEEYYQIIFGSTARIWYVVMYILAIVVADIPTFIKHRNHPNYASLGASGAVSAVVFTSILFAPWAKIYIWGLVGIPGIVLGVAYLVYSAFKGRQGGDLVNHDAHFYGALFGIVFTIILRPSLATYFVNQLIEGFPL